MKWRDRFWSPPVSDVSGSPRTWSTSKQPLASTIAPHLGQLETACLLFDKFHINMDKPICLRQTILTLRDAQLLQGFAPSSLESIDFVE